MQPNYPDNNFPPQPPRNPYQPPPPPRPPQQPTQNPYPPQPPFRPQPSPQFSPNPPTSNNPHQPPPLNHSQPPPPNFQDFNKKSNKKLFGIIGGILLLGVVGVLGFVFLTSSSNSNLAKVENQYTTFLEESSALLKEMEDSVATYEKSVKDFCDNATVRATEEQRKKFSLGTEGMNAVILWDKWDDFNQRMDEFNDTDLANSLVYNPSQPIEDNSKYEKLVGLLEDIVANKSERIKVQSRGFDARREFSSCDLKKPRS